MRGVCRRGVCRRGVCRRGVCRRGVYDAHLREYGELLAEEVVGEIHRGVHHTHAVSTNR
jgi:hypothetical protein